MEQQILNQREAYKLIEKITSGTFNGELDLLKTLVNEIIQHSNFEIEGGRIWSLNPESNSYKLIYQHGRVNKIPDGYEIKIEGHDVFSTLISERAVLRRETDGLLREKGIRLYSLTGVGKIIPAGKDRYYKYALGFNSEKISETFDEILSIISSVATIALSNLSVEARQKKISRDLVKASEIQNNLLPEHYLEFHDYKIFGICVPDDAVGGDYFDYIKSPENEEERLSVLISDAASKGLPAAIQALFVSGAIRMGLAFSARISQLLTYLNNLIYYTFPYERFVTLFYCELTLSSNRLVLYSNAGHCEPIHYKPSHESIKQLPATGGLLGILKNQHFSLENIRMDHGDVLVLYTDGISEAQNGDGDFYGTSRIENMVKEHYKKDVKSLAYLLLEDVQKYSVNSPYSDDKTIVVIKRD